MEQCISQKSNADGEKDAGYVVEPGRLRVRDFPERMRPREEMDRLGVRNVADDVLLSILLRSGVSGVNVVDLSKNLMVKYGSLTGLAAANLDELAAFRGVGRVKAQVIAAALEIARRFNEESAPRTCKIKTPADVAVILRETARMLEKETFWALMLDARNNLKSKPVEVSVGLLDSSLVHAREVFREAVRSASAAIVLAHNHPSGDTSPSAEDIRITKHLVEAGRVVDIKVLDHVILGKATGMDGRDFLSLKESGIVNFG